MVNSVLDRKWGISLADILEATDISAEQKVNYTLDIGGSTGNIRNRIDQLNVLDSEAVLAECDRIDQVV